jgi:hypothetical protein
LFHSKDCLTLLCHTLCTALPSSLVLDTTGLHLVCEDFGAVLLGLGLVDVLHEYTLVLENVTL